MPLSKKPICLVLKTRFWTQTGLPWWLSGKESAFNTGDPGSIPGSGRSPGGGNVIQLHYSCLKNPMDRGAWWATFHRVAKSWTQLTQLKSSLTVPET